jgi:putative addiction module killer protein
MGGGNFGKDRHLGGGLHEAKMDFGPGYRLYYGYRRGKLILLLCGGNKSNQARDIRAAGVYWRDYQEGGSR